MHVCIYVHGVLHAFLNEGNFTDYHQLHVHRNLKDYITGLHANKSDNAIVRVSKCMDVLMELKHNFRTGLGKSVAAPSDLHSPANHAQDLKAVIDEVLAVNAFILQPPQTGQSSRHHSTMNPFHPLLYNVNEDKLQEWVRKTGKKIMCDQ